MNRAPDNSEFREELLSTATAFEGPQKEIRERRGQGGKIGRISRTMLAAIFAAAPQVSCSGDFEEPVPIEKDTTVVAPENVEESKGEAMVFLDSQDNWYFQGTYPESFQLKVYASKSPSKTVPEPAENELIFDDLVKTGAGGSFSINDYSGSSETVWIVVRAYNSQTGEEITIGPNPGPEGIKGMPFARNYDGLE